MIWGKSAHEAAWLGYYAGCWLLAACHCWLLAAAANFVHIERIRFLMLAQIIEIPVIGSVETLGIVGILATLMLFFMRLYFSKAREYEDCLKEKALPPPPSPPLAVSEKEPK